MPSSFLLNKPYGDNASITIDGPTPDTTATTAQGFDPNDMLFTTEEKGWQASVLVDPHIVNGGLNSILIDRDSTISVNTLAMLANAESANMKIIFDTSPDNFTLGANNSYLQQPFNFGISGDLDKSEMINDNWSKESFPAGSGRQFVFTSPGFEIPAGLPSASTERLYLDMTDIQDISGIPILIQFKVSGGVWAGGANKLRVIDFDGAVWDNQFSVTEDGTYWFIYTPAAGTERIGVGATSGWTGKVEFMRWWRAEDIESPIFNGVNVAWMPLGQEVTDRYIRLSFYNTDTTLRINHLDYDTPFIMPSFVNTDFNNFEISGTVAESQGGFFISSNIESIIKIIPLQWPVLKEDSAEFANILTWSEEVWKKLRPWFIFPESDEDTIIFVWPPINKVKFSAVLESKSTKNIRIPAMSCRSRGA